MQTVQDGGDEVLYGYWHMGFGGTQLQQNMLAHEWIYTEPFHYCESPALVMGFEIDRLLQTGDCQLG